MSPARPVPTAALVLLALAWSTLAGPPARAQQMQQQEMLPGRQVTLFGVLATPGTAKDDAKLKEVLPQLRTLLPGHSFKLVKVESKRLTANEKIACNLGGGFVASGQLVTPLDANGKVQLRFDFTVDGLPQYQTIVNTPPNQIFYCNRMLPSGERLIVGLGAR